MSDSSIFIYLNGFTRWSRVLAGVACPKSGESSRDRRNLDAQTQGVDISALFDCKYGFVGPACLTNDLVALFHAVLVKQHGANDDETRKERLPVALETHGHESLLENAHDEHANDGSNQRSGAAAHGRAANDDARDAEQLLSVAGAGNN